MNALTDAMGRSHQGVARERLSLPRSTLRGVQSFHDLDACFKAPLQRVSKSFLQKLRRNVLLRAAKEYLSYGVVG